MTRLSWLAKGTTVFVAAALHAISWLDERYFALAWLGLVILFWAIRGKSTVEAITCSFAFGCIALAISFHWAKDTLAYTLACEDGDALPYVAFTTLILWESIPFALLGYIYIKGDRAEFPICAIPLVWVLIEVFWPRVFLWNFAHSQTGFTSFLQAAELGGAAFVSFFFVAGCVGVSQLNVPKGSASFQAEIMVTSAILCAFLGFVRKTYVQAELAASAGHSFLKVGVVQIDPSYVESTVKMRGEIDKNMMGVDLIVLPESTLGTYSTSVQQLSEMKQDTRFARAPFIQVEPFGGLSADLLVGGKSFEPNAEESGPYFQTAFVLGAKGDIRARYYKRYLLPIGEYVPLESLFPQFHEWAQLDQYTASGGSAAPVELTNGTNIGVLVCYEDTVADAARTTVTEGAEVLICIINGSAFDSSVALDQHRRLAQLRAIENRRAFLRCTATGTSCHVSPTGELLRSLPHFSEGSFQSSVPRLRYLTLFTRGGYMLPYACIFILGTYFSYAWLCRPMLAKVALRNSVSMDTGLVERNPSVAGAEE